MKKNSLSIFPIVVAGVCMAIFVMTADAVKIVHPKLSQGSNNVVPGQYIIRFNPNQVPAGSSFTQSVQGTHEDVEVKVKRKFSHSFFSGVTVAVEASNDEVHAAALKTILDRSDVKAVYPVRRIARPQVTLKKGKKDVPTVLPHGMTQVDLVHTELKNKGKGILVAILDTGIDYLHPAFGGGFGKGYKVSKGFDLVGDAYTGSNTPKPDNDPLDNCGADSGASGHGTHVAGIIAGYDKATNFTGVAPEANLGMWRVFGCTGSTTNDVVIQGLLSAYDAGAHVINLSLGETNSWANANDAELSVVDKIVAKGVSVVISAGNSGAKGIYTVGQPSTADGAFSVASIQNGNYVAKNFEASGIDRKILYTASNDDTIKDGEVVAGEARPGNGADACTADSVPDSVSGKIALIQRGTCTFVTKVENAAAKGAVGVVLYNNVDGTFSASTPGVSIPVISVSKADGLAILEASKSKAVTLTFDKAGAVVPVADAGTVSSFSSLGASSELNFKPNIAGIGGVVYSTVPRYLGAWGVMSGTSMAAPYVAGSMALYLHAHGKENKPIKFINEQFQNYALSVPVDQSTSIDTPIRQGAGLVQVYDAITQKVHISPAQISFNDTATTKYRTQTITITNHGTKTVQYEAVNDVAVGVSPYDVAKTGYAPLEPAKNVNAAAKIKFSVKSFKLAPGKSQKVKVTVTPPSTDPKDHVFYGGFIHFKSKQQKSNVDVKVPYFGVVGKQNTLPIFDEGFPTILDSKSKEYDQIDTFTYDRADSKTAPIVVVRLLTPAPKIKAELLDAETEKVLGEFLTGLEYLGRNFVSEDQFTNLPWDGTYVPSSIASAPLPIPVPSGAYKFRLRALKLLADPKKASSWEVYTSGNIVVKN
ncbi:Minor extracellular protease vpr [Choanephora cucurbitarum]|uniref:Minor extracellular protease vpr n=1 Tax=Choanephora cucurbitarum TaxID=101091 RepID=A0A1C7NA67_9FUNG|nr:Minor extracellular protease vpr [Choanephora cucurbitarum]